MNSKSTVKKAISLFLCFAVVLAYTIGFINPLVADADSVNVGANPTPAVDIAVTVPSDYPGTFLDFKQELSQKLIEQESSPFFGVNFSVAINHSNSMYSRNCNLPWLNEIVNALPR